MNTDGKVDADDLTAMLCYLVTQNQQIGETADLNNDQQINARDLSLLKQKIMAAAKTAEQQQTAAQEQPQQQEQQPVQLAAGQWYNTANTSWINGRKVVAISFDDGPVTGTSASRIQDALTKQGFHATFFYWGSKINSGNENEIREAEKRGFEVANHTWTHPKLTEKDNNTILSEYNQTKDKLNSILGVNRDYLLRPPYLAVDDKVKNMIPSPLINCGIDSGDWNKATTQQMIDKIQAAANNGTLNGQVVLMHETYDTTAAAVEQLCPWLAEHGYAIVTVSEMFKYNNKDMFKGNVYNNCF
ncbi:MAG: polysaccharide deacetylase family protein [Oscillospiraceae bacterium]|nr:polysaccharide deacetylase family protein [Oscillospiraceae bacterium]